MDEEQEYGDPEAEVRPVLAFYRRPWVRVMAAIVALSMFFLAAYSGLRVIFSW